MLVQLCSFNPWSPPAVLEDLKQSAFNACVPAIKKTDCLTLKCNVGFPAGFSALIELNSIGQAQGTVFCVGLVNVCLYILTLNTDLDIPGALLLL